MGLTGGWNALQARATDRAGQVSPPSNPVRVQLPAHPPLILVGARTGGGWLCRAGQSRLSCGPSPVAATTRTGRPRSGCAARYPTAAEAALNQTPSSLSQPEGEWRSGWTVPATTAYGWYEFLFSAADEVGLRGDGQTSLFIDSVAPNAPSILHPASDLTVSNSTVEVVGSAEPLATVVLYRNGTPVQTLQADAQGHWGATLTLIDGLNRVDATVRDGAGNLSLPSPSRNLLYDHTPPQVSGEVIPVYIQPGQKVTLRAVLTDTGTIATATAFVQAGVPIPLTRRNGGWESVYPVNLPPGIYPITFRAVDQANNIGYGAATLVVDNTAPTVKTITIDASQPYGYQIPGTIPPRVYYGVGSGSITVTASLTDDLAGLAEVTFPAATSAGATYPQNGKLQATLPHRYTFDASSTFAGTVAIQAADRAGNTVTSNLVLIHDTVPPTMTLDATADGLTLSLAWSAGDAGAGLKACTLELLTGATTTTLSTACAGALPYPAVNDASYTVRLTATDNVANRATQEATVTVSSVTKYYYHGSTRIAMRKGGQLYYLHGDHLGSTSLTTDASGKVVHDARYLPYGQVRWESWVIHHRLWLHRPAERVWFWADGFQCSILLGAVGDVHPARYPCVRSDQRRRLQSLHVCPRESSSL